MQFREMRKDKRAQAEEGIGDNEEMTSMKGRIKPATEKECGEWLVKGKEGNESMGVGEIESARIPWTANLPVSPFYTTPLPSTRTTPTPMSQTHLKCCCFSCRVPTTTSRQTEWV